MDFNLRGQQGMIFLIRKHYCGLFTHIFAKSNSLKMKHLNDGFFSCKHNFLLHKTLIHGLDSCGLLWCFYQLFGLSIWRHPFTAEHPSELMLNFYKSVLMRKQTHLHLWLSMSEYNFIKLSFLGEIFLQSTTFSSQHWNFKPMQRSYIWPFFKISSLVFHRRTCWGKLRLSK